MQWQILTVHLRAGYDGIGFRQVRTFGELYKLARIDASSTESTVAECAEERSSKGRLRSNGEAARKGPRPRVKNQATELSNSSHWRGRRNAPQSEARREPARSAPGGPARGCDTSIRSKNLRMLRICVLHKALKGEKRPTLMPEEPLLSDMVCRDI